MEGRGKSFALSHGGHIYNLQHYSRSLPGAVNATCQEPGQRRLQRTAGAGRTPDAKLHRVVAESKGCLTVPSIIRHTEGKVT